VKSKPQAAKKQASPKHGRTWLMGGVFAIALVACAVYVSGPSDGMRSVRHAAVANTPEAWAKVADVEAVQAQWQSQFSKRVAGGAGAPLSAEDRAKIDETVRRQLTPQLVVGLVSAQLGRTPEERSKKLEGLKASNALKLVGHWKGLSNYQYDVIDPKGVTRLNVSLGRRGWSWKVTGIEITGM